MEKVSLREYAKRHKLSYFNVMKMVKNGDIKSVIETVGSKELEYVLIEEEQEKRVNESIIETSAKTLTLKDKNMLLKKEIERLKLALEKCNKRTLLA